MKRLVFYSEFGEIRMEYYDSDISKNKTVYRGWYGKDNQFISPFKNIILLFKDNSRINSFIIYEEIAEYLITEILKNEEQRRYLTSVRKAAINDCKSRYCKD